MALEIQKISKIYLTILDYQEISLLEILNIKKKSLENKCLLYGIIKIK